LIRAKKKAKDFGQSMKEFYAEKRKKEKEKQDQIALFPEKKEEITVKPPSHTVNSIHLN